MSASTPNKHRCPRCRKQRKYMPGEGGSNTKRRVRARYWTRTAEGFVCNVCVERLAGTPDAIAPVPDPPPRGRAIGGWALGGER